MANPDDIQVTDSSIGIPRSSKGGDGWPSRHHGESLRYEQQGAPNINKCSWNV